MEHTNPNYIDFAKKLMGLVGLLVVLLVAENIWLGLGYMPRRNEADSSKDLVKAYPLLDPARQFYRPDDLIINIQPLRDQLNDIGKNPEVSIYFEVLNTGANIVVNKDAEFFPASLLKVPLAMAVMRKIEKDEWRWSDKIVLQESDKDKGFGDLWQQPTGTAFTVEELLQQLLGKSDNTAHLMLLRNLKPEELLRVQEHLGLLDFFSQDKKISARRYAPILRSLFSASYLSMADSEKILQLLTESGFNGYIASGIPKDIKFAHKIGVSDAEHVHLDAGIVYLPDRPYMLIVMVQEPDDTKALNLVKVISEKAYNYMVDYPLSAANYVPAAEATGAGAKTTM